MLLSSADVAVNVAAYPRQYVAHSLGLFLNCEGSSDSILVLHVGDGESLKANEVSKRS